MLEKIKGQKKAVQQLAADLESGRLAESYLFAGPEGAGKKLAALEFAKAVNCSGVMRDSLIPDSTTPNIPCGECSSCQKVDSGTHPEIFVLDFKSQSELLDLNSEQEIKQKEYRIGSIRSLLEKAHLSSYETRKKVLIIDGAECLNLEAGNALLKALEESPRQCLWILVTKSPERVLMTIRSRCRRVWFSPPEIVLDEDASAAEKLASEFLERGAQSVSGALEMSARAVALDKKLGTRKAAEQFLKCLAIKMSSDLRENPTNMKAEKLLNIIQAQEGLSKNLSPQIVLDSVLPSLL